MQRFSEYNFDGIVGPTHHYGGLSVGNLASTQHAGRLANPQAAALQGLEKMRFLASLGIPQAVLPPVARPPTRALAELGYTGALELCLRRAYQDSPALLSRLFSASSMWTANAATVVPSPDTLDGRVHLLVANLSAMPHRSLEPPDTENILRAIFNNDHHFAVHPALPGYLGDEGAANQLRLATPDHALHLLAWGKRLDAASHTQRFEARQSLEASQAASRWCQLSPERTLLWQQLPAGIDAGAFHSDVLAVGHQHVLLLHEQAFVDHERLLSTLSTVFEGALECCLAHNSELPVHDAVKSYPFNSQLVSLSDGNMAIIAPDEVQGSAPALQFLERAKSEIEAIQNIYYVNVNSSMDNGGGPACLRLRVLLSEGERDAIVARVFFDDALYTELKSWVTRHYRTRLMLEDLQDPSLVDESYTALDELTQLLELGSIYEFQSLERIC